MKVKTINNTIQEKVSDWMSSLPMELAEKISGKVVVTGGCIASMLLREKVNDYDMYFKDIKTAILVSQYYCNTWIEDNEKQRISGKVVKDIQPCLRLTFKEGTLHNYYEKFTNPDTRLDVNTITINPYDPYLDEFLNDYSAWSNVVRVEIFIKSAGFVGNNPDEEYDYFESREDGAAEDYISKSIMNEESINQEDSGKYNIIFMSSNAITLSDKVQLVIRFFGEPSDIHDTYDFVHATNYWTSKTGVVTNTKALEALLARELVYTGSKYPLASIFRTRKFIKREWNCHVGNYIKMALQLNEMDLNDPEILAQQLTGVDQAYCWEVINAVKNKKKAEPDFEFNSAYLCELVDRFMGVTGEPDDDVR